MSRKKDLIEKLLNHEDVAKSFYNVMDTEISLSRSVYVCADIEEDTGEAIANMIRFWNEYDDENYPDLPLDQRQPIKIYINSCGGDLAAGFTMVDAITLSRTPVTTINIGKAYSAALLTFISGHKRIAYPNSSFMMHEGSAGMSGDGHKFVNFTAFYKKQLNQIKDIVLKHTHYKEEEYESDRKDDIWLDAKDALEKGFCDEIASRMV